MFLSDRIDPLKIGNPNEFTINQLAELVLEILESQSGVDHRPLPVNDPKVRRPDTTAASELLGWSPQIELRDGLLKTIEYFREVLDLDSART